MKYSNQNDVTDNRRELMIWKSIGKYVVCLFCPFYFPKLYFKHLQICFYLELFSDDILFVKILICDAKAYKTLQTHGEHKFPQLVSHCKSPFKWTLKLDTNKWIKKTAYTHTRTHDSFPFLLFWRCQKRIRTQIKCHLIVLIAYGKKICNIQHKNANFKSDQKMWRYFCILVSNYVRYRSLARTLHTFPIHCHSPQTCCIDKKKFF